jgi:CRISPR-associated endonuclease/helicase Cas3
MSTPYSSWFEAHAGHLPHPWQAELGAAADCQDRLIRVPTGLGKTLGVLAAWSYHRLVRRDPAWPRRLVLCLPMRVLVEQTEAAVREWLERLGRLWTQVSERPGDGEVGVHLLLGGAAARDWHLFPEHEAVLVGTQDMLLSRALNRGYGSPRARWPMEHALLRQDALWVLDEVQLMDVGLRTSVQLQAFHRAESKIRPRVCWWMSATLQPTWLDSVDFADRLPDLRARALRVPAAQRKGPLFAARKPLQLDTLPAADDRRCEAWARRVLAAHLDAPKADRGRLTLAIANTVDDARNLHDALHKELAKGRQPIELRLVHSRFRGRERAAWRRDFLNRAACSAGADRILVATQVVEAGVDISADVLVTALAPWPSLVQRFGRAARYGGTAPVFVIDRQLSDKAAAPYSEGELLAARQVLGGLADVGLTALEELEERLAADDPDLLARLYPYAPLHSLTRGELAELFDTGPDLTGSDLDISRFIRSGDERDLQVWWWPIEGDPPPDLQPMRHALCPVPVKDARAWLVPQDRSIRAWRWSYLEGAWERVRREADLFAGQLVLVDAAAGGYLPDRGFVGAESRAPVDCRDDDRKAGEGIEQALLAADNAQDHEDLSEREAYKTIAYHGHETAEEARQLAAALGLDGALTRLLDLAGRLHDLGKAHPEFQAAIAARDAALAERTDLAKAPPPAWKRGQIFKRPGFRHELASALALLEALYQSQPDHPALLGPHRPLIDLGALDVDRAHLAAERPAPTGVLAELVALDAPQLDLVLYLVCAHHGKVRGTWQQTPADQAARPTKDDGLPLRGVLDGDRFPATPVAGADGPTALPAVTLCLDPARLGLSPRYGASWRERVHGLRRAHGDADLVLLESLLRVADIRASQRRTRDPWLTEETA